MAAAKAPTPKDVAEVFLLPELSRVEVLVDRLTKHATAEERKKHAPWWKWVLFLWWWKPLKFIFVKIVPGVALVAFVALIVHSCF